MTDTVEAQPKRKRGRQPGSGMAAAGFETFTIRVPIPTSDAFRKHVDRASPRRSLNSHVVYLIEQDLAQG